MKIEQLLFVMLILSGTASMRGVDDGQQQFLLMLLMHRKELSSQPQRLERSAAQLVVQAEHIRVSGEQRFYKMVTLPDNVFGLISSLNKEAAEMLASYIQRYKAENEATRKMYEDGVHLPGGTAEFVYKKIERVCDVLSPYGQCVCCDLEPCTHKGSACVDYCSRAKELLRQRAKASEETHEAIVLVPIFDESIHEREQE